MRWVGIRTWSAAVGIRTWSAAHMRWPGIALNAEPA
jgi:hypothetical protein